jgi:GNAT superfamily N-acetyltransferase
LCWPPGRVSGHAPDGGLAGAVVLARYPPALAVMGMLLVASRHGRRGVGRTLMQHVMAQVVYLHATAQGRPLYERLGFTVTGAVIRHIGHYQPASPGPGPVVRARARLTAPGFLPWTGPSSAATAPLS